MNCFHTNSWSYPTVCSVYCVLQQSIWSVSTMLKSTSHIFLFKGYLRYCSLRRITTTHPTNVPVAPIATEPTKEIASCTRTTSITTLSLLVIAVVSTLVLTVFCTIFSVRSKKCRLFWRGMYSFNRKQSVYYEPIDNQSTGVIVDSGEYSPNGPKDNGVCTVQH